MPKATIVVPAYNAAKTLPETLASLCNQTFSDFEIIVVDDGSQDETTTITNQHAYRDQRIRLIRQQNRGLAGARNSGIAAALGHYVGFCDADDLWLPEKLALHIAHMDNAPQVGLSYSGSVMIDQDSRHFGATQRPRLRNITAAHVFKRNPVGNGSAAIFRRDALQDIAWLPKGETAREWVFDETLRQSEDVECWLRFALSTDWDIEGIPGLLTEYRINGSGLSADTEAQFHAWETMVDKLRPLSPAFFQRHEPAARAYQHRYLARRAISTHNARTARKHLSRSLKAALTPLFEEPIRSSTTIAATVMLSCFGARPILGIQRLLQSCKTYFGRG